MPSRRKKKKLIFAELAVSREPESGVTAPPVCVILLSLAV